MCRALLKFLSLLIILGTIDLAASRRRYDPDGYIYHSDIQTSYKFFNNPVDWMTARARCESEGGRLPVIDTWTKLRYINSIKPPLVWAWVGIYRQAMGDSWRDIDHRPVVGVLPWAILNPKPFFGDCVAVNGLGLINAPGLSNWNCGIRKTFVCEKLDTTMIRIVA